MDKDINFMHNYEDDEDDENNNNDSDKKEENNFNDFLLKEGLI